jgi:hypothetical protein
MTYEHIDLEPVDQDEAVDHPDEPLDEAEAERGQAAYLAVDDLDDESNGLDS